MGKVVAPQLELLEIQSAQDLSPAEFLFSLPVAPIAPVVLDVPITVVQPTQQTTSLPEPGSAVSS